MFLAAVPSCEDEYPPFILECRFFEGMSMEEAIESVSQNTDFHDLHSSLWAEFKEPSLEWIEGVLLYKYSDSGKCLKVISNCEFQIKCN